MLYYICDTDITNVICGGWRAGAAEVWRVERKAAGGVAKLRGWRNGGWRRRCDSSGGAARNGASLSSVAAPLLPVVERSHTAAEPALHPPHPPCLLLYFKRMPQEPYVYEIGVFYQFTDPQ